MTSELMRGPNRSRKMSVATIPAASTGITSLNPELLQMYVLQSLKTGELNRILTVVQT